MKILIGEKIVLSVPSEVVVLLKKVSVRKLRCASAHTKLLLAVFETVSEKIALRVPNGKAVVLLKNFDQ